MAVPVVSEPVPAVVGTAIRGFNFAVMGFPCPNFGVNLSLDGSVYKHTKWCIYEVKKLSI